MDDKQPAPAASVEKSAAEHLHDAIQSIRDEQRSPAEPPYLPDLSVRSEYQKLCDELGGPVEGLTPNATQSLFRRSCSEYSPGSIVRLLIQYNDEINIARRHWPHAAIAISQYVFEIKERASYVEDEPTPAKVLELLSHIAQSASELTASLCRLQTLSNRIKDPNAPNRRGHLSWLDAFISQAAAGYLSNDVNENPEHQRLMLQGKLALIQRLKEIEGTAKRAKERADRGLLERERGPSNPALVKFVRRCGPIWTSLTGRNPTAEKLTRTSGSEDPEFVLFMQQLARVAGAPEPKRTEVDLCLKRYP